MKKLYLSFILINLLKIWSYFSLVLFLMSLWNTIFGDPVLLNSINSIHDHDYNTTDNLDSKDQGNSIPQYYHLSKNNYYQRTKRWLHWRVFINKSDRYQSYDEFKNIWSPEFSIRKIVKSEFKSFVKHPVEYVKEDKEYFYKQLAKDNHQYEMIKSTQYLGGYGWLNKNQLNSLAKDGYIVRNSTLVKIAK